MMISDEQLILIYKHFSPKELSEITCHIKAGHSVKFIDNRNGMFPEIPPGYVIRVRDESSKLIDEFFSISNYVTNY